MNAKNANKSQSFDPVCVYWRSFADCRFLVRAASNSWLDRHFLTIFTALAPRKAAD
jgi:hypothetical protein